MKKTMRLLIGFVLVILICQLFISVKSIYALTGSGSGNWSGYNCFAGYNEWWTPVNYQGVSSTTGAVCSATGNIPVTLTLSVNDSPLWQQSVDYASTAATNATNAYNAANAASTNATNAYNAANTAATNATNAYNAANNANTNAANASSYASTAATNSAYSGYSTAYWGYYAYANAANASGYASSASTYATEARNEVRFGSYNGGKSLGAAYDQAAAANSNASNASTNASTAATKASDAKVSADAAKASADTTVTQTFYSGKSAAQWASEAAQDNISPTLDVNWANGATITTASHQQTIEVAVSDNVSSVPNISLAYSKDNEATWTAFTGASVTVTFNPAPAYQTLVVRATDQAGKLTKKRIGIFVI